MPSNARDIEIPEPEYTDLLNVSVNTDKKRKLHCPDIGGGINVRVKKETGNNEIIRIKKIIYKYK